MDATDLAFAGIARQAELIREKVVSPRELVETYLERINRLDSQLNAFRIVFAERALAEADEAGARLEGGDERPLLGVPIAVKDCFDVAGETTPNGSEANADVPADADAEIVRRLREAGALILGKTNVPELCQWPFTETARFGYTRNPWNPSRVPGGSSGGSAAAVAAGLVGAAVGSDGAGSIRIPAGCCGIFGIKPQRGRVSLMPWPQHWNGMSVAGPLTRGVLDAALFLDVVSGGAPGDAHSTPAPTEPFAESAKRPPGTLRVAVSAAPPIFPQPIDADCVRGMRETADLLRSLGHEVVEKDPPYDWPGRLETIARYTYGVNQDARATTDPTRLERRTKGMSRLGATYRPLMNWVAAQEGKYARRLGRLWDEVDVLLTPTLAKPAVAVGSWEGRSGLATFNGVARFTPFQAAFNATGQPGVSVPAGLSSGGLPVGAQLIGRTNDEATLISLSAQIEAERPWAGERPPVS